MPLSGEVHHLVLKWKGICCPYVKSQSSPDFDPRFKVQIFLYIGKFILQYSVVTDILQSDCITTSACAFNY